MSVIFFTPGGTRGFITISSPAVMAVSIPDRIAGDEYQAKTDITQCVCLARTDRALGHQPTYHIEGKKPMLLGKARFPSYIDQEWGHLACKTVCSLVFLCKCAEWHEHAARQAGIRFYENTPLFYS